MVPLDSEYFLRVLSDDTGRFCKKTLKPVSNEMFDFYRTKLVKSKLIYYNDDRLRVSVRLTPLGQAWIKLLQ